MAPPIWRIPVFQFSYNYYYFWRHVSFLGVVIIEWPVSGDDYSIPFERDPGSDQSFNDTVNVNWNAGNKLAGIQKLVRSISLEGVGLFVSLVPSLDSCLSKWLLKSNPKLK